MPGEAQLTVPGLLARAASRFPDHAAFVFPEERPAYRLLDRRARVGARPLNGQGGGNGEPVGVLMPHCLDFAHLMFGVSMAGALLVTINARLAPREIRHIVVDSGMRMLVTTHLVDNVVDYVDRLGAAFPGW